MDLKEIKELITLMKRNDLSVFKMEREGFKIVLKKGADFQRAVTGAPVAAAPAPVSTPAPAGTAAMAAYEAAATDESYKEITSPMVGTFYRASSPETAPYVEVGTDISEESVVCIIEAMKVMNEIKAEVRGRIMEVLVETGKPVQFGQALFKVR